MAIKNFETTNDVTVFVQISDGGRLASVSFDGLQSHSTHWLKIEELKQLADLIKELIKEHHGQKAGN